MSEEGQSSFGFKDVEAREKVRLVRGVFDRVAERYDLMNDLMSAGAHRLWKDATAAKLNPQPGETIVDCAGGTGDMARRLASLSRKARERRGGLDARVMVIDYNAEMVAAGRARGSEPEIAWSVGDAQALALPDACADAYVIAFGIRNVADVPTALKEARRVLKRGGRFFCLEFSRPVSDGLRRAYDAYSFKVIPEIGRLVANDREVLSVPGREHPAVSRSEAFRCDDRTGRVQARRLHQLLGRGDGAASRLGDLSRP